ncbi:hypothetical protein EYR41_011890 [Orbilia oligospora]|uniref:Uncharacterized protein n=1 Tax=Orbilia oligospora TaxID=2813651 RepID=A0A8H2HME6_ORBOL|nr:hypothetical protein EYR41_011890 [Orbilia oligospora]
MTGSFSPVPEEEQEIRPSSAPASLRIRSPWATAPMNFLSSSSEPEENRSISPDFASTSTEPNALNPEAFEFIPRPFYPEVPGLKSETTQARPVYPQAPPAGFQQLAPLAPDDNTARSNATNGDATSFNAAYGNATGPNATNGDTTNSNAADGDATGSNAAGGDATGPNAAGGDATDANANTALPVSEHTGSAANALAELRPPWTSRPTPTSRAIHATASASISQSLANTKPATRLHLAAATHQIRVPRITHATSTPKTPKDEDPLPAPATVSPSHMAAPNVDQGCVQESSALKAGLTVSSAASEPETAPALTLSTAAVPPQMPSPEPTGERLTNVDAPKSPDVGMTDSGNLPVIMDPVLQ